jgi:hypothetical protein
MESLAGLPAASCPAGYESSVVNRYIEQALLRAPSLIEASNVKVRQTGEGTEYDPADWFYIRVSALNIIIWQRDNQMHWDATDTMSVPTLTERDMQLAYADHYLQMRAMAFNFGPDHRAELENAVVHYDQLKVRGLVPQTGVGEVTPATNTSVFWCLAGMQAGCQDRMEHAAHLHIREAIFDSAYIVGMAARLV